MNYRSFDDMNRIIQQSLWRIPSDIDVVVGVPRSGMLPATLISLYKHLPLTDLEGLIEGRLLKSGPRLGPREVTDLAGRPTTRALVVDDSTATGAEMRRVRERLQAANVSVDATMLAIFATPESCSLVDLYFESVEMPRVFEWNLFNAWFIPEACIDIDGVLCRDPTDEENDDGPRYMNFLKTVEPLFRVRTEIGSLVTSRLEKYRPETEEWLRKNGVSYKRLHMMNYSSAAERRAAGKYSEFKAEIYADSYAPLFIESAYPLAVEIARKSLKPVFCTEVMKMIAPGEEETGLVGPVVDAIGWKYRTLAGRGRRKMARILRRVAFRLLKGVQ